MSRDEADERREETRRLLDEAVTNGLDAHDFERLDTMLVGELRSIAHRYRKAPGQTLQTTDLVNELYLRFYAATPPAWDSRKHFFASAARAMQNILKDAARRRSASKRGGDRLRIPLDGVVVTPDENRIDLLDLSEALNRLDIERARSAQVVRLKFFCGLPIAEIASLLGLDSRTIERDWRFARSWLQTELTRGTT